MSTDIRPIDPARLPPLPALPTSLQQLVMLLALLYWISPIDLVPFFPVDDLVVMVAGYLFYSHTPAPKDGAQ